MGVTYKEGANQVAHAIEVDAAGNVYVTGRSSAIGLFETDFATIKYNQVQIACGKMAIKYWFVIKAKKTRVLTVQIPQNTSIMATSWAPVL